MRVPFRCCAHWSIKIRKILSTNTIWVLHTQARASRLKRGNRWRQHSSCSPISPDQRTPRRLWRSWITRSHARLLLCSDLWVDLGAEDQAQQATRAGPPGIGFCRAPFFLELTVTFMHSCEQAILKAVTDLTGHGFG